VPALDRVAVRQKILATARRIGLEPQLRRAQDAFTPRSQLRNKRDDAHLCAIMTAVLAPDANCIDVGANAGDVLGTMVRLAPEGRHIAYEPLPELAGSLAERFPGVDVRNIALSDTSGEATFYRDPAADSRSSLSPGNGSEPLTVRLGTLDQDLPEGYRPRFVKIDVEGAELAVLRGGAETLARHRPHIAIEHGSSAATFGTTHRMIHDFLVGELGMRIFDMDGAGPFGADEFDLVADPPGDRWNFIACP
jgi:FkbM family methyltransferase